MQTGNTIVLSQNVAARRINPVAKSGGHDEPFEPGTRIDRYLILERLGGGSIGQVYRARDTELDREVALKVLGRPYCHQPEAINRFRAEAQAQARLRSPHVVTLYSMLELPFAAMLVLEYVQGETLETRLRTVGTLAADEAIRIFEQALLGLMHVHEMGVIHRDLKPSNIFITSGGVVKIMDFSVAKVATQDAYPPRTMVGTLLYISPEQISGRDIDARSDIYALGVSLYEAITGKLPFERGTDYGLMHAHVQEQPPRPRDLVPSLPPVFERVILKAIQKEPAHRFRSAEEFRTALLKLGKPSEQDASLPANAYGPVLPAEFERRSGLRVLTSLGLDLALVFAICAVVYALGLYPGQSAPPADTIVTQTTTAAPTPASTRSTRPPKSSTAAPADSRDPYHALRRAWGD